MIRIFINDKGTLHKAPLEDVYVTKTKNTVSVNYTINADKIRQILGIPKEVREEVNEQQQPTKFNNISMVNDRGNIFDFESHFIYISSIKAKDRIICIDIKPYANKLYNLLCKVIDDTENFIFKTGGTRNIDLVSVNGEYSEKTSMTIDIYSSLNNLVEFTFTLEDLRKTKPNQICQLRMNVLEAKRILKWLLFNIDLKGESEKL